MIIAIGSTNKAKERAVIQAMTAAGVEAQILPVGVSSGVSDQPFSDEETRRGAVNRARTALLTVEADVGIGLEGGVMETAEGLFLCNWGALAAKDQQVITAGGARILLPSFIASRLRKGEELGPVMDEYCQRAGIRQKEGAVGVFSNGLVTRDEMFLHVAKLLWGQYSLKK
ncbi:DUF84 family protein [Bacillus xiapuensis]|uniref:DUF84 family protein n=1 Tax=Bacillus xiapuensis TaxID=2014075 RepID=UPI000C24B845|nr:DUF84 family protein [Bacillus xiapuensis]